MFDTILSEMQTFQFREPRYQTANESVLKIMRDRYSGNKEEYINYIQNQLFTDGTSQMNLRSTFENNVTVSASALSSWTDYISFEAAKGDK